MANYKRKPIIFYVNENGCFICTSHSLTFGGYVRIKRNGKVSTLHRYIYKECFGEIPEDIIIRHTCDTPQCINPEHLIEGTTADNVHDMHERGRAAKQFGEDNAKTTLTEEQVRKIRTQTHIHREILARYYGVSERTIRRIWNRSTWKHIL